MSGTLYHTKFFIEALYFYAKASPAFPIRPAPGISLKDRYDGVFNLLLGVAFGGKLYLTESSASIN